MLLSDLTKNDYTSKDSFSFAQDICSQNCNLFMMSFDIYSLFTNSQIYMLIKFYNQRVKSPIKTEFRICYQKSFFKFNNNIYNQVDWVCIGSPLGPRLAKVFLCHWGEIWLRKCPKQFATKYCFMDDTLFNSQDDIKSSTNILDLITKMLLWLTKTCFGFMWLK